MEGGRGRQGPSQQFSSSGLYTVPQGAKWEEHVEYIESLPVLAEPEAYGLHANADITKDLGDTNQMLATLIKTGGSSDGGGGRMPRAARSLLRRSSNRTIRDWE